MFLKFKSFLKDLKDRIISFISIFYHLLTIKISKDISSNFNEFIGCFSVIIRLPYLSF